MKNKTVKRAILEIKELEQFKDELSNEGIFIKIRSNFLDSVDSKNLKQDIPNKIRRKKILLRDLINRMFRHGSWLYVQSSPDSAVKKFSQKAYFLEKREKRPGKEYIQQESKRTRKRYIQ
jgi:hypothetical protein